ncbi:kdo(2)-lipid IV(A) palmitoleoyltransferase [Martelella alba]|uniref:Kdo(2)-lipid IV(A) palmitoleoyltransferase n=1 Tax=Martelella alba TaxID=2590451 RepID=A0ABY2SPA7_9HYPH|nr:kdo(2)-lipid IV(A) palmitoleoyltransferase [Martelella alba]TKI06986.1 kdo(2)-lipid IV(A) palmitoleoyltransferase [Martelella alba]
MRKTSAFSRQLLHPRYWITWLGLGLLILLVQLPYPVLMALGRGVGLSARPFLKRREDITRRNIRLCFPTMPASSVDTLVAENFASLGMALMETGMAWFWPDNRVKRWFDVSGLQHLRAASKHHRGVMVIGVHFMSLELGGRVMGLCQPMMAMYRPHNNQAMEWMQTKGRMRSNKAMIDRKDLRGMVHALKQGESVWFAPDQDYGPRGSVFAPLFAVPQAATTNGTFVLCHLAKPAMLTVVLIRKPRNQGYQLVIQPEITDYPAEDALSAAAYMNRIIETEILRAPEQYLWLHRRFKTRPVGKPSLYVD